MTDNVFLNADRTKVVPEHAVGKKWQVPRAEAVRLGLLKGDKEPQERRPAFDATKAHVPPQQRRTSKRK